MKDFSKIFNMLREKGVKIKMDSLLKRFKKVKILVIGDIMIDRFIWGRVSRISPEAPVPVVLFEKEEFLLGGAANVINNIVSLGGIGSICGIVGDDEMGNKLIKKFEEMGIDTKGIFIEIGRQTTIKTRIIAHQQQVVRIDRETTSSPKNSLMAEVLEFLKNNIGQQISIYIKGADITLRGELIELYSDSLTILTFFKQRIYIPKDSVGYIEIKKEEKKK